MLTRSWSTDGLHCRVIMPGRVTGDLTYICRPSVLGCSVSPEGDPPISHLRGVSLFALIVGAEMGKGLRVSPYVVFHSLQL